MECNHQWEVDTNCILTSNPPQYKIQCKLCNKIDYIKTEDAYKYPQKESEFFTFIIKNI